MPRPERAVDPADGPVAAFAHQLRGARRAAGLTLTELGEKTFYAKSTLSVAFSGQRLPTWELVQRVVRECGATDADERLWRARWEAARQGKQPDAVQAPEGARDGDREDRGRLRRVTRGPRLPDPTHASSMAELAEELNQLRLYQGFSWRQLAAASLEDHDGQGVSAPPDAALTPSTLHDAIVARAAPSLGLTLRVVQLCGGTTSDLVVWGRQWAKLAEQEAKIKERRHTYEAHAAPRIVDLLIRFIDRSSVDPEQSRRAIRLLTTLAMILLTPLLALAYLVSNSQNPSMPLGILAVAVSVGIMAQMVRTMRTVADRSARPAADRPRRSRRPRKRRRPRYPPPSSRHDPTS